EQRATGACADAGAAGRRVELCLGILIERDREPLAPALLIEGRLQQPAMLRAVLQREIIVVRAAEKAHLRTAEITFLRARPSPRGMTDRRYVRLAAARGKIHEQLLDLAFRHRLEMLAERINGPARLIWRGIKRRPRGLNELE